MPFLLLGEFSFFSFFIFMIFCPKFCLFITALQGVNATRNFLLEWLSFTHRYVPHALLAAPLRTAGMQMQMKWRPPPFIGRDDRETLLASPLVSGACCFAFSVVCCSNSKHGSGVYTKLVMVHHLISTLSRSSSRLQNHISNIPISQIGSRSLNCFSGVRRPALCLSPNTAAMRTNVIQSSLPPSSTSIGIKHSCKYQTI